MESPAEPVSIAWHQLLGKLLELTLTPVDIQVETEVQITAQPPKADILLLRRKTARWTEAQRALLPDGIRESRAAHQLLEFKYSESVSEEALAQAVAYEYFYRTARHLPAKDVQVWLISSKTPRRSRLQAWGYEETDWPGVYRSSAVLVDRVGLLVLNQLSPALYNSFVKIFASRQGERERAFQQMDQASHLESSTHSFLFGLREAVEVEENPYMTIVITPEFVMRRGEELKRVALELLTAEELTARLTPEELTARLTPEQRLAGLKLEERVAGLAADDLLSHLSFEEIEAYLEEHRPKPEDKADTNK